MAPFHRRNVFLAVMAAGVATPWMAVEAQPIAQVDRSAAARSLFEQGLRFVDQERWGEAWECFRRSRSMVERPNTIYNLGLASFRLGRHNDAIRAFEEYLHLPYDRRDRPQRTRAARMRAESLAAVSTLRLFIEPVSSEVRVDGVLVSAAGGGAIREILLDPGVHSLEATAEGHRTQRETVSATPGAAMVRRLALPVDPSGGRRVADATTGEATVAGTASPGPPDAIGAVPPPPESVQVPPSRAAIAPPVRETPMSQALACHRENGADRAAANECVVRVLRGRATTGAEISLLCVSYREMGRRADAEPCMERYIRLDQNGPHASSFQRYLNGDE